MAKKKVEAKAAKATTNKKNIDGSEEQHQEQVGDERLFEDPPCNVGVSGGFTYNLGNFNSAKVQISINVPCPHDEIDETYEFAKEWVDDRVQESYDELEEVE